MALLGDETLPEGATLDFERLLTSGGDERIAIDPRTGRNRYGTPRGLAHGETWFSSSTATAISARGYDAARDAYLSAVRPGRARSIPIWLDQTRARLSELFGIPGTEVILSGSGTELELIALFLARNALHGPLTNVVVAPGETGRGVLLAASGRHFLGSSPFGETREHGSWVEGFETSRSSIETIEIRDEAGGLKSSESVDAEVVRKVEAGVANGRCALVHLLDCSKTGRGGPRRSTASALLERYPGQVLVVVDSCQLRCSPEQIRADLRAGFMVMITGSKFAAGPPFAGAMLLPPLIMGQLATLDLPSGLLAYASAEDWPAALRRKISRPFAVTENVGAGLRWEAALAELEALFALPVQFRESVVTAFGSAVERHVREHPDLELIDPGLADVLQPYPTIFPIVTAARSGALPACDAIYRALRLPLPDDPAAETSKRVFHVGQPVPVGQHNALRVCLSASQIVDVAENVKKGHAFKTAIAPLMADLDHLFLKWSRVADQLCSPA